MRISGFINVKIREQSMNKKKSCKAPMSRSEIMSRIKSKNTSIEKKLAKAMWTAGLRYRKNVRTIYGTPDFVFKSKKIAIFCDSEFWHGKKFIEGEYFKTNITFWEDKIKRNIQHDIKVNDTLKANGWRVIRFWGKEIEKNLSECILKIISVYKEANAA
jgi:DNA mismatch endonuclease, patch repair protein